MRVTNMKSDKTGKSIPNQFKIYDGDGTTYFQSYQSIIVKQQGTHIYLDEEYWNYSNTTSKYRNQFLNETTKQTKEKIKSGKYKLLDLNKGELK